MRKILYLVPLVMVLSSCISNDDYSGTGGMTEYSIKSNAYLYHYKNGFTGVDAMGWDPDLQHIWSRLGAALTCGISFDKPYVVKRLKDKYGHSEIVHDMNGIQFHYLQSKKIANFCTPERITELEKVIHDFSDEQNQISSVDEKLVLRKKLIMSNLI